MFVIDYEQTFLHVIGEGEPKGICGTGLIDAVAELLRYGIINITGKIEIPQSGNIPDWLSKHLIEGEKNNSFILVPKEVISGGNQLMITQRDIRELQLGKGAIAAGIKILCNELKIEISDIEEVLIAGAFGSYLNKFNAQRIGLIPDIPADRVKFVGNAASLGAKKFLVSKKAQKEAEKIIDFAEYIELSSQSDFQDIFAESMLFVFEEKF